MGEKLDFVWGAKEIGAEINRSEAQVHYLLERGLIRSARKFGKRWVVERQALREEFSGKPRGDAA